MTRDYQEQLDDFTRSRDGLLGELRACGTLEQREKIYARLRDRLTEGAIWTLRKELGDVDVAGVSVGHPWPSPRVELTPLEWARECRAAHGVFVHSMTKLGDAVGYNLGPDGPMLQLGALLARVEAFEAEKERQAAAAATESR